MRMFRPAQAAEFVEDALEIRESYPPFPYVPLPPSPPRNRRTVRAGKTTEQSKTSLDFPYERLRKGTSLADSAPILDLD